MQPQQSYYVLQIHFVGRPPATQTFSAHRVVIGRDGGDIVLHDTEASATHAELEFQDGQLVVRDLGSSNGTWKDGRQLPQFALSQGDSFTCGKTVMTVVQIAGFKHQASGGTVMGDGAKMIAQLEQQKAAAAAAPPAKSGGGAGLAIAAVLGVLVLGGGGAAAYFLLGQGDDTEVVASNAADSEGEEKVEEPETPSMPKLDIPAPVPDEKDPHEDEPVVEKDLGELYRKVGAATVVIRVPGSVGSGSIIDPKGIVLTNHHVIDGGEREGLKIKANVTLGQWSEELQAFEPQEKTLHAYVLKVDLDHDLALLQLVDPPADLPFLKISEKAPYPGQRVAAVGHAGAGLLWALKGGEVSSTGKLAGHTDLALGEAEGYQKEHLAKLKAQMDKQGRVVQSTAKILPGDSGGPLVATSTGELVAVNAFVRRDMTTNQWLSFHVHLAEVQKLLEEVPDHPLDFIPDPWAIAALNVNGDDVDLDGRVETVVASASELGSETAYYLDLDQSSLGKGARLPAWDELTEKKDDRPFDAELVVVDRGGNRNVWYDTDNDGHFDVFMLGTVGNLTQAYTVPKEGAATESRQLLVKDGLDAGLFTDSRAKEGYGRIAPVVFPDAAEAGDGETKIPNPKASADSFLTADNDGDGTVDTFVEASYFHRRYLFDLDQNAGIDDGYAMSSRVGSADLELIVLEQGPSKWVFYDADDDGTLETVLHSKVLGFTGASEAWVSGAPAPDQLGQAMFRKSLVASEDARTRMATVLPKAMPGQEVQSGEGVESFPALTFGPRASVAIRDSGGLHNAVAMVTEYGRDLVLIDLDGDSAKEGTNHQDLAKQVRTGEFDAEFAMLKVADVRWTFYDTNGKGGFDWVVVASNPGDRTPTAAYKVNKAGKVKVQEEPGGALLRKSLFKKPKLAEAFAKAVPPLFPGQLED